MGCPLTQATGPAQHSILVPLSPCRHWLAQFRCPSVGYQLAGAKKVQQDLARPGVLERFLDSPADAELCRACFAGEPA